MMLEHCTEGRIILRGSDKFYTRRELLHSSEQLQQHLLRTGLTRVALYAENGCDWIIADLACIEAEICLIPLPTFFSGQQLRHALETCNVTTIITDHPDALLTKLGAEQQFSTTKSLGSLHLVQLPKADRAVAIPPGTAKITFTSGSTGQPKGVCLSHAQLRRQAEALRDLVALEQPRHLCLLPLSTLLENVAGVYAPLLANGEILVPSGESLGFRGSALVAPMQLLAQLTELQPHTLILIPELLAFLTASARRGWPVPTSLRFVAVGGARVPADAVVAARDCGIPVFEGYGLSECASVVSLNTRRHDLPGSCGQPLPTVNVTIDDGEVVVHGNAMLGYVNEPESWQKAAITTGDLGHFDSSGFLHISGRKKNVLITSYGRNISPEWVESELLVNSRLSEALVLGDGRPYCVALLSPATADVTDEELDSWVTQVNAQLPDYARVRNWYRLPIPLRASPVLMTPNGKPRRDKIAELMQDEIDALYAVDLSPDRVA